DSVSNGAAWSRDRHLLMAKAWVRKRVEAGLQRICRHNPFRSSGSRIIYYHSVHPSLPMSHTPEQFQEQLHYLRDNGYRFLTLGNLSKNLPGQLREKFVVITFDD